MGDFSGDFDLGDMEGTNQQIDGDMVYNAKKSIYDLHKVEINNAPEDEYFHHAICFFYMMCTVFFNICMLNVFIGLLSKVYDDLSKKSHDLFEEFRGDYSFKFLSQRV